MAEVTQGEKRIAAVAKELNVGVTHLVESLNKKGFKVDNKPTTKITIEMYNTLLQEFSQDKANKAQAEKISLGRGVAPIVAPKVEEKPAPTSKVKEEREVLVKDNTSGNKAIEKKPAAKEKEKEKEKEEEKPPVAEEKVVKAKSPILKGPKIVGKIDIEPKEEVKPEAPKEEEDTAAKKPKGKKKKEEEVVEDTPKPVAEEVKPAEEAPAAETPADKPKDDKGPTIKTEYETLSGPKILGKVDLSSIKSKPADYSDIIKGAQDKKRQRKRIYSSDQKKAETPEAFKAREGQAAPPQQGGGYQGNRPNTGGGYQGNRPNTGGGYQGNRPNTGGGYQGNRPNQNRPGGGQRPPFERRPVKREEGQEVTEKEIQDKIKETMARLSGATPNKAKGTKADYRRARRKEAAAEKETETTGSNVVQLTEFVSVTELASLLGVPMVDVIKTCMNLGIIVSINQRLDAEVIELVAHEFGKDVSFISMEEQVEMEIEDVDDPAELEGRPPIVTIMGHVDHGKTSLLDYIREANVVAGEVGGITQHIGAYEVTKGDRKITFLDTPGHEAFTAMRARGAKITDIAVIVIAADDSIMPQTKEAISHAQAAGVPIIFAFNKMDKPGANADNIRQQLASMNLLVEEWSGKFQSQEISAKTGANVDLLLEKILLESDLLDLKANPNKFATGSVIEATLDKGRGYVTTILVQDGTLALGDTIVAGSNSGRVKAMFNERGQRVKDAGPSTPVQVLGLDGAPQAGEKFKAYEDEQEAKQVATKRAQISREQGIRTKKHITLDEIGRRLALGNFKELNVIVKADFDGSVEALSDSLLKLSTQEIQINIVFRGVGQITESDVLLATASDAIIIGFQVRPSATARKLAEKENIEIRLYSIIYDAIEELKGAMEGMLEPKIEEKIIAGVEIREVFKIPKVGSVAGCYVTEGKLTRNTKIHLIRDGIVTFTGELSSLKRFKDDVREVTSGMECGLTIKNFNDMKVGDIVEGYEEVEVKRTL